MPPFRAWDAKFSYNYWRPVTAIQEAATDGNPDTTADPTWRPLGGSGWPSVQPRGSDEPGKLRGRLHAAVSGLDFRPRHDGRSLVPVLGIVLWHK